MMRWLDQSLLKRRSFAFSITLILASGLGFSSTALSLSLTSKVSYYGDQFYQDVSQGKRDSDLVDSLRVVLESRHAVNKGGMDTVPATCDSSATGCYQHRSIGYGAARKVLMGQLHLENNAGQYTVKDVYCEKVFTGADSVGPGRVPPSSKLNTEHTWPQSRFNGSMGKDVQKSDLHHLFPTDSEMNSARSSFKFGDVDVTHKALKCPTVKLGTARGSSSEVFEPPVAHKGNVARALFYFSVRYRLAIDPREEAFLRAWHRLDPVDADERERNEAIFKIQSNRNPFVDHPELESAIADF